MPLSTTEAKPLSKAEYDNQMTAILESFAIDLSQLANTNTARTARVALIKLQGELADTERRLVKVTPPQPIKTDQADLVAAMVEFKSELAPAIAKLTTDDETAVSSVSTLKGLNDVASAVQAIVKAGYDIG